MRAGVLALQGAFQEHCDRFAGLGVEAIEVRHPRDLAGIDALVMPGGESTTIGAQARELDLIEPIRRLIASNVPVWGTCAGLILLARHIKGGQPHLGVLDVTVERNGYGRQAQSFEADLKVPVLDDCVTQGKSDGERARLFPGVFIRAPRITAVGSEVETLSVWGGAAVAVRQNNVLATSFHPELTIDSRFHEYFLGLHTYRQQRSCPSRQLCTAHQVAIDLAGGPAPLIDCPDD